MKRGNVTKPEPTDLYEHSECSYFSGGTCESCALLRVERGRRLVAKQDDLRAILARNGLSNVPRAELIIPSQPWASRRKIKMAVTGSAREPKLGMVRRDLSASDLTNCPLHPDAISDLLRALRSLITSLQIQPYDIIARTGELKYIIIMATEDLTQAILRFVLRSPEAIPLIQRAASIIQRDFHWIRVISSNIQPLPAALLEGEKEIVLTEQDSIEERYGDVNLRLTPQSFMQVTPEIATKLYQYVASWARHQQPASVLDLFCGIGGFSLHVAPFVGSVTGVEISRQAIECATASSGIAGLTNTSFIAMDVEQYLSTQKPHPDLIIANPPRRGLGERIVEAIIEMAPRAIAYSSCNPETFAQDTQALLSRYTLHCIQPFDMFPMTRHVEVVGTFTATAP